MKRILLSALALIGLSSILSAQTYSVPNTFSDGHGTPRASTETRPSNVSVYWYIKVR
jgi:hypothetical protein